MAQQTINTGTSELAGDGESIRSAFGKVNENFDEVYSDIADLDGSKIVYGDLSVTTASASGAGALSYDSSTGTFTFTPAASGFDGDYNSLTNKPTIPTVPTALSSFTNDSGYITGYTVTESDVTTHQAALSITESQISDLSHFSGDYNDLTNKPTIPTVPTAVSAFTNDSGYITGYTVTESDVTTHQAALSITESQISDFGTYATTAAIGNSGNWDTAYSWGNHANAGYVESDTTGITGADQVTNMVTLTQAEYDAIGTPNASTVYFIVG